MVSSNRYIIGLFAITFLLISKTAYPQKAIIIQQDAGALIDSSMNYKHLLFTDFPFDQFRGAQVFKFGDKSLELRIYLSDGKTIQKKIDKEELFRIKTRIRFYENDYIQNDTSTIYSVYLNDGSLLKGKIKNLNHKSTTIHIENTGPINIPTDKINSIKNPKDEIKTDIADISNPFPSNYFFGPSAISPKADENSIRVTNIFLVSGDLSLGNHIGIGGGISLIPGIELDEQLLYLNMRSGFQISEKLYAGMGGMYFSMTDYITFGLGYLYTTYGNKDHNLTFNLGYGYSHYGWLENPTFSLSGMTRVGKRISIITENWLFTTKYEEYTGNGSEIVPKLEGIFMYGVRIFNENIYFDVCFMNFYVDEQFYFPGFPIVNFAAKF